MQWLISLILLISHFSLSSEVRVNPTWNPAKLCSLVFVLSWILYRLELNQLIWNGCCFCVIVYLTVHYMRGVEEFVLWKENSSFSVKTSTLPFVLTGLLICSCKESAICRLSLYRWTVPIVKELLSSEREAGHLIHVMKGRKLRERFLKMS